MFSVGFIRKAAVISPLNQRRISRLNVDSFCGIVKEQLRSPIKKIIIDLKGVKFIDSHSFSIIGSLYQRAYYNNQVLEFANVDAEVLELFDLVPEAKKYKVHAQVEQAVEQEQVVLA